MFWLKSSRPSYRFHKKKESGRVQFDTRECNPKAPQHKGLVRLKNFPENYLKLLSKLFRFLSSAYISKTVESAEKKQENCTSTNWRQHQRPSVDFLHQNRTEETDAQVEATGSEIRPFGVHWTEADGFEDWHGIIKNLWRVWTWVDCWLKSSKAYSIDSGQLLASLHCTNQHKWKKQFRISQNSENSLLLVRPFTWRFDRVQLFQRHVMTVAKFPQLTHCSWSIARYWAKVLWTFRKQSIRQCANNEKDELKAQREVPQIWRPKDFL